MRLRLLLVVVLASAFASPASAQYFRNNAFTIKAGWMGLGSTWDSATGLKMWNMSDQVQIGAGYSYALGYQLWLDTSATLGMGALRIPDDEFGGQQLIADLTIDTGLRYNFLEERVRPFISGHINYLQVVTPSAQIPANTLTGAPFWVGARVGGGLELFHVDEQSVLIEATITGYVGINSPPKPNGDLTYVLPATQAQLSYQIYF
jgi:hypothetical protein